MSELLIELADKLNEMGYWAIYRPGADILFCTIHTQDEQEAAAMMTHTTLNDGKYQFIYFADRLPVVKELDTEDQLLSFLEEYYWKEN
ncbi:hypothetical protein JMG10_19405 [Nostoc ellipsosporum NOK]|nr:hypothetical protein [Nostoc ellipsosporum NOK]